MADIKMCNGEHCLIKHNCFRYTAVPNTHSQVYFGDSPCHINGTLCDYFYSNKNMNNRNFKYLGG